MCTRTHAPARRRGRRRGVLPVDDRQRHRGPQVVDPVPRLERRRDVAARRRGTARVSGVSPRSASTVSIVYVGPGAVDLEPRRLEPVDAVERGHDHLEADLGRCERRGPASATDRRRRRRAPGRARAGRGRRPRPRDARRAPGRRCRRGCRGAPPGECTRRACERRVARRLAAPDRGRNLPPVPSLVVRVWLPDRPGALGLVASRIGAIGGDIVGIDVLERSEHVAVDEFAVMLARHATSSRSSSARSKRSTARRSKQWREVDDVSRPAPRRARVGRAPLGAEHARRADARLVDSVRDEFAADWAVVLRGDRACSRRRGADDPRLLRAGSARGRNRARRRASRPATPGPKISRSRRSRAATAVLLVGRDGHPFRRRERRQLLALARIADRVGDDPPR